MFLKATMLKITKTIIKVDEKDPKVTHYNVKYVRNLSILQLNTTFDI